ncbi:MAG: response regulator [Desulfobacterales bacterium]|nr:response regulator [Desulfobacterales bacterium]
MLELKSNSPEATDLLSQSIQNIFFKPRVLIVDDEDRIRSACTRLLNDEGCDVAEADNGIKGLKMIEEEHFDIVLLDLMMPGLSGLEVLSDVKSRHPDTVIIVITGYATLEHSIESMKRGAFDFLAKPFAPQDLRVVISKAIEFIRTLQDIASEKSRMRVMINTLRDGVLTTDHQKRIALANPAFLRMMGSPKRSVIGHEMGEVIPDAKIVDMIDQAMSQGPDQYAELTEEFELAGLDCVEPVTIGVRCIPFRDRLKRCLGAVTVFHDITQRKKVEAMKSEFVSMVAHEIKSPLNSILMQLKVVLDGLAGELTPKQQEILSRSSDKLTSLTELATELLDLSKIESGLINQERETLDLGELINAQVGFYRNQADAKSIHLNALPSPQGIAIMANRTNMEEVLSNLISNAIRYTPNNGSIDVWAEEENGNALVHVRDTGLGIPESEMDHIFDRFFRVKNEKTRFINGTGLGLTIVKKIVAAHHGRIHVESRLDKGSCFTVTLPKSSLETV